MKPDIVIIGSGMGGATLAASLAPTGVQIVMLERGDYMRPSPECRDDDAIFKRGFFRSDEQWLTPSGAGFSPGNFYYVGGNTKFYGGVMLRYRAEDFTEMQHLGGTSPAWPLSYTDFAPWYDKAEALFDVRGHAGEDPTDPIRAGAYPYPAVPDEASIADVRARLRRAGVSPASLPLAVDIEHWLMGGDDSWDGHPDTTGAKRDAESVGIAKAKQYENFTLITGAMVKRLQTDSKQRITEIHYEKDGEFHTLKPKIAILSAGAVNSAALLLRSANDAHPTGLANSSDLVGRRFMNHNCTALMAINPWRANTAIYQKTLYFNDFYLKGGPNNSPLGNMQLLGKITTPILRSQARIPTRVADWITRHSVDWYAMSEDLPSLESRVTLKGDQIVLDWKRSNWEAHEALVAQAKKVMRKAGYPIMLSRAFDRATPSHQCGTAVFGTDPKASVLDLHCRAHDHPNLFVVDASFLPNSAAVNPALTIAAQALRVAEHIKNKDLKE
ncbi:GMC oxidoreductase [Falsihalocynthiibacter arcticus]|nr:GMC family oxidoreductase [Falsihalocynthiibacter arcticus]